MKLLNVGDVVYFESPFGLTKHKIHRVTEKKAYVGNTVIERNVDERFHIPTIPKRGKWDTEGYCLPNETLDHQFALEEVQNKVRMLKACDIGVEKLKTIANLLEVKI